MVHDFEAVHVNEIPVEVVSPAPAAAPKKLGWLDTYLSLWILIACGLGLGLGQLDGMIAFINVTSVDTTNILVAIGLILMMFPPLVTPILHLGFLHSVSGKSPMGEDVDRVLRQETTRPHILLELDLRTHAHVPPVHRFLRTSVEVLWHHEWVKSGGVCSMHRNGPGVERSFWWRC